MKTKAAKLERPKFTRVSEEMKRWSALLGEELLTWPKVAARPMFGYLGYYRSKKIFAALPVTRTMGNSNSFIFRMIPMPPDLLRRALAEPRIGSGRGPGAKWRSFEVNSEGDLHDALWWLGQAYERAK